MKTNDEIRRENLLIAIGRMRTAAALATKAGVSAAYLSQVKRQSPDSSTGTPKSMGDDVARRIEIALGEPVGWMDANHVGLNRIEEHQFNAGPEQELIQGRYVAIVGIGQGGPDGYLSIDDYSPGDGDGFIYTYSQDPDAYGIRVRGDSMRPRIKSGEFIVVEPTSEAQPGDDVVVKLKTDRALVKELLWVRDGEVSLGSINNGIPPISIQLKDVISIHRVAAIVPRGSALLKANR